MVFGESTWRPKETEANSWFNFRISRDTDGCAIFLMYCILGFPPTKSVSLAYTLNFIPVPAWVSKTFNVDGKSHGSWQLSWNRQEEMSRTHLIHKGASSK